MDQNNPDIAPELLKALQEDFEKRLSANEKLKDIYGKVNAGTATYLEANAFALGAGNILSEVFRDNISADALPNGRMYFNIADRTIRPMMENNYNLVSEVCVQVQGRLNQLANLGIKAVKPELNDDRIRGIVNKVSEAEDYDDVSWVLDEPMRTFSQSIVDDYIRANVDFQGKSGLYPKIERVAAAGCCEWCVDMAGTYRYPDVPKDIYRRHAHCRCVVDYDPADGRGQRQNVHDKSWQSEGEYREKLEKMKYVGLNDAEQHAKIDYRKTVGLNDEENSIKTEYRKIVGQYDLNYDEGKAVTEYFSSKSYVINEKLRMETPLSEEEMAFCRDMDAALKKIPTYSGNLSRSLYFTRQEEAMEFVSKFQKDEIIVFDEYISTTKGPELYNPDGQVQIYIQNAQKGHDMEKLKDDELEVLYERHSKFVTVEKVQQNGIWYILLEEG